MNAHGGRTLARQFTWFVGVGALGFLVDAVLFLVLTKACCSWPILWARAVSATCSITTTWALNRRVTFADRKSPDKAGEYLRYVVAQIVGLSVNLGIFSLCLLTEPRLKRFPIVALAIGAAAALVFNFVMARTMAFRGATTHERDTHPTQEPANPRPKSTV